MKPSAAKLMIAILISIVNRLFLFQFFKTTCGFLLNSAKIALKYLTIFKSF